MEKLGNSISLLQDWNKIKLIELLYSNNNSSYEDFTYDSYPRKPTHFSRWMNWL